VKFALTLAGVALQLTVAGFFEVVEPGLGVYTLLLWVPVALGAIFIIARSGRKASPSAGLQPPPTSAS